jgi:hypothetical protein
MGITKADLDAQRAMIERGEEKRTERERLRDTFAAAALTGLLSNIPRYQLGVIAVQAYDIADEMLRERLRNGAVECRETVQHDRPSGVSGAWAEAANQQLRERGHYGSSPRSTTHDAVPEAKAGASVSSVPLGKAQASSESAPHGPSASQFSQPADAQGTGNTHTLTDEEREAVEWYANFPDGIHAATLRNLLERLK